MTHETTGAAPGGETMTPELMPCPFCGETPHLEFHDDESLWSKEIVTYATVNCDGCDATQHSVCDDPRGERAAASWNIRFVPASSPTKEGTETALEREGRCACDHLKSWHSKTGVCSMKGCPCIVGNFTSLSSTPTRAATDAPQPPMMTDNGFPRRNRVDLWHAAERAIQDAVDVCERQLPGDTLETDAVTLLGKARDKIGELVDREIRAGRMPMPSRRSEWTEKDAARLERILPVIETIGPDWIDARHTSVPVGDLRLMRREILRLRAALSSSPSSTTATPLLRSDNGFPRRNRTDLWTEAEAAIQHAVDVCERTIPADPLETDAIILLGDARNKIGELVDREIAAGRMPMPSRPARGLNVMCPQCGCDVVEGLREDVRSGVADEDEVRLLAAMESLSSSPSSTTATPLSEEMGFVRLNIALAKNEIGGSYEGKALRDIARAADYLDAALLCLDRLSALPSSRALSEIAIREAFFAGACFGGFSDARESSVNEAANEYASCFMERVGR